MKRIFKSIILFILCMSIVLSLISCTKNNKNNNNDSDYFWKPVKFGDYYKNCNDKLYPLYWHVFDVDDSKVYLITARVIDCVPFYTDGQPMFWSASYIRQWLNDDFYNTAFSDEEKELLCLEKLSILNNSNLGLSAGRFAEETEDKVFLMTANQANDASQSILRAQVSPYAKEKGVFVEPKYDYGMWWLMSPGYNLQTAAVVDIYGTIHNGSGESTKYTDVSMFDDYVGVRPVIAIDYDDFVEIYDDIQVDIIN